LLLHPEYNKPSHFDNDLALVFFDAPGFSITDFVRPICLWNFDYHFSSIENKIGVVNLYCKLCWIYQIDVNFRRLLDLAKPKTTLWPRTFRKWTWWSNLTFNVTWGRDPSSESTWNLEGTSAQEEMVSDEDLVLISGVLKNWCCFWFSGSTACMGDSGGGFALRKGRKWYLRGVVSFGNTFTKEIAKEEMISVCKESWPSLYNDVANQMDWIKLNVFPDSTPAPPS
jgi:hypothetical protein